jgi:hypothetical protein
LQRIINSTKDLIKTSLDFAVSQSPDSKNEDDLDDEALKPVKPVFEFDAKSIAALQSVVTEVEAWLFEKLAVQEKLKLWEEPALFLNDLEKQGNQVQTALRKLIMEQAKAKISTKSTTSASSATSSSFTAILGQSDFEQVPSATQAVKEKVTDTVIVMTGTVSNNVESETGNTGKHIHEEL